MSPNTAGAPPPSCTGDAAGRVGIPSDENHRATPRSSRPGQLIRHTEALAAACERLQCSFASGAVRPLEAQGRNLFEGISGYVFDDGSRARLLIGPFRNSDEARVFADDLASVHIDAFTWTSQPGQTIRKLPSE